MKHVKLKQLVLCNFKGTRDFTVKFEQRTDLLGANGTGKTTIVDAPNWLLYGKNSLNQSDFNVRTLDSENNFIPKLEHFVEGVYDVNGTEIVFKRVLIEKWAKKRGNENEEFTGTETRYFVDGVPKKKSEFETEVANMVEESISKIISNPLYFNGSMKWQDRRETLSAMAGEITDDMIFESMTTESSEVVILLNQKTDLEDEKKRLAVKRNKLKEEIKEVQPTINGVNSMKPEGKDWANIEDQITKAKGSIELIEGQITDKNSGLDDQRTKISEAKAAEFKLQEEYDELDRLNKAAVNVVDPKITEQTTQLTNENISHKSVKTNALFEIGTNDTTIERIASLRKTQLSKWHVENDKVFKNDQATECPTCERKYDNLADLEQEAKNAETNFNTKKVENLGAIEKDGKVHAKKIKELEEENVSLKVSADNAQISFDLNAAKILELTKKSKPSTDAIQPTERMTQLQAEINAVVIPKLVEPDSLPFLREQKTELTEKVDNLKEELAVKSQIQEANEKIEKLENSKRTLSQELASIERVEMQIDSFNKAKIEMVEGRVNKLFTFAKFKMFTSQINGGETPSCECMVDGVPYNDLNTAMKTNVGLDIISAIQHHSKVFAPVFVDHKESVSVLHPMECQIITLAVDIDTPKLSIIS